MFPDSSTEFQEPLSPRKTLPLVLSTEVCLHSTLIGTVKLLAWVLQPSQLPGGSRSEGHTPRATSGIRR